MEAELNITMLLTSSPPAVLHSTYPSVVHQISAGTLGQLKLGVTSGSRSTDLLELALNDSNSSTSSVLMQAPTFNEVSLTKAVVFGVMFVISFIGNTATLMQMYRLRRRKSTINTLIVNLALADLLVTFFCIAGEAIWAATVQWLAGTFTCKLVKYMQVFALYLSTYITVAISLDRCVAILDPMRRNGATYRVRVMIGLGWVFSAIFSIPQAVVFHVMRGPFQEEFYQCVTFGSYKEEWQRQLYSIASLLLMFVVPLVIIGTAYGLIFTTISRKSREVSVLDSLNPLNRRKALITVLRHYGHACLCGEGCDPKLSREESIVSSCSGDVNGRGPVRSNLLRRAKRKSLRMSVVIVLAFIICWSPYYIIFICITFLDWQEIDPRTLLWFSFIGLSSSMLNPIIYGAFQLCKVHKPRFVFNSSSSCPSCSSFLQHPILYTSIAFVLVLLMMSDLLPIVTKMRSWRKGEWPGSSLKEMAKFRGAHSSKPLLAPHLAPHDTRANCLSSATSSASSRGRLVTECRCESCAQERRRQLMTSSPLPDTWLRNGPTGVVREECRRFGHKHLLPGDVKRCCFFHSC